MIITIVLLLIIIGALSYDNNELRKRYNRERSENHDLLIKLHEMEDKK